MRYVVALVLVVFAVGVAGAADEPAAECLDAIHKVLGAKAAEQKENFAAAVTLCTKAAERGDAEAQLFLGFMYELGFSVPLDKAKALEWYTKAAEQGDARAQHELARMYANGEGVPENDAKAVEWYTKAAEQGYHIAQYNLARMLYAAGTGVPEDYVQAYKWVVLASAGTPDAMDLGRAKRKKAKRLRKRLQRKMTEEQLAEGERLASEWLEKFKAEQDGN